MHDILESHQLRLGQQVQLAHHAGVTVSATITSVAPQYNHLGARWAVLTADTEDGSSLTFDTRNGLVLTPERTETAWCTECGRRREVEDAGPESYYDGGREHFVQVTRLDCGHNLHAHLGAGPAPGEPYAGGVVARSASPADVRDARNEQVRLARVDA